MNEGKKEAYVYCGGDIEEGLSEEEGVKHDEHGLPISRSLEEVNEPNFWEGNSRIVFFFFFATFLFAVVLLLLFWLLRMMRILAYNEEGR